MFNLMFLYYPYISDNYFVDQIYFIKTFALYRVHILDTYMKIAYYIKRQPFLFIKHKYI